MTESGDHGRRARLTYSNPQIQRLRRLLGRRSSRSEEGAFVVEGAGLVEQAVAAGWEVEAQYLAPGADAVDGAGPVLTTAPNVIERVATTDSPRPMLAVVRTRRAPLPGGCSFVVVADALADPGNLGTIIRSAEAAGADAVGVTAGSVDAFNPKAVRASAGSLFRIPVVETDLADLRASGLRLFGTSSHRGEPHRSADLSGRIAVVMGNEAHGLDDDVAVDGWLTIRCAPGVESLNVAMAATLLCFEVARQQQRTA